MALKSDQAKVLRRRVLGALGRNLALFTTAFVLVCLLFDSFVSPRLGDYVADRTSSWRTLDSTAQFRQILAEQGIGQDADGMFDTWVAEFTEGGYSDGEGTAEELRPDIEALEDEAAAWVKGQTEGVPSEEDEKTAKEKEKAIKEFEKQGIVVEDGQSVSSASVGGDIRTDLYLEDDWIADAADALSEGGGRMIGYEKILAAEGIDPATASAAQAMAALQMEGIVFAMGLFLGAPSPLLPPEMTDDDAVRILLAASSAGYTQTELDDILLNAYRDSQNRAYDEWMALDPGEEARQLGVSDEHPIWQIVQGDDGVYAIRDIAVYTLVKSFKLPLAALIFVVGWLIIILSALNRSLRYFDDLSGAVGKVLADKNAPIELPADLSIARNELAVIRSQSLADERAARAAEQRKDELVAYLAHDIRTPLTSVLGYLDLLRETTDLPRDTLRKYADVAYTKAERLEGLINEFFEITRYNLSAIPIERETVGVRLFCQQVAEAFFPEASARNIRISVDVSPAAQFFVDPDKLARALGNVMRNAVAYADANSVIALTSRQEGPFTVITVANRGREISAAHLETIFEKFYREDTSRATRSGGAGLGLAIAKEIVVAHHGDIEAASERGVTVFTLRIPTRGEGEGAVHGSGAAPVRASEVAPARTSEAVPVRANGAAANRTGKAAAVRRKVDASARTRELPPQLKPRNARHGRGAQSAPLRDNGATARMQPQRRKH